MKKLIGIFGLVIILNMITACTDLVTKETDSKVIKSSAAGGGGDPAALLESSYKDLGTFTDQANIFSLTEHTTDELIPPTRGVDWGDNGVWRSLYAHTWDATHQYVLDAWNNLNSRAFKNNQILASKPSASQSAEAKFLRAFYMFHVMDFYGQVPFREITDGVDVNPKVLSRSEAFDFIVKDLTEALPELSVIAPNATNTTASKAAANALLARLYLNKAVYKASNPSGPYTHDKADMDKVVAYCDAVKADGFDFETSYFNNFTLNASKEIILTVRHDSGTPQNRVFMTLHYGQNPSGWNGFTTLADFYGKFEAADSRRSAPSPAPLNSKYYGIKRGFLIGQQFDDKGAQLIDSRSQKPLVFSPDVPLAGAATEKGIRVMKYHPVDWEAGTHYILLRYSDVHLMKAEAVLRGGTSSSTAKDLVNNLRAARGASALATLDEAAMLDERGRELYWEGVRRTDVIRFGKFNATYSEKTNTEAFRVLFPIPQQAIDSNPNLKQNTGYGGN
jgi:starch-binding outer membrane protein, SusD/RagB family